MSAVIQWKPERYRSNQPKETKQLGMDQLSISHTSLQLDWHILQDIFPGRFLNDQGNVRCVPMVNVTQAEKDKLVSKYRVEHLDRYLFLVSTN